MSDNEAANDLGALTSRIDMLQQVMISPEADTEDVLAASRLLTKTRSAIAAREAEQTKAREAYLASPEGRAIEAIRAQRQAVQQVEGYIPARGLTGSPPSGSQTPLSPHEQLAAEWKAKQAAAQVQGYIPARGLKPVR